MFHKNIIFCILVISSATAGANSLEDKLQDLARNRILALANTPEVVNSVKAQNVRNATLSQTDIDILDKQWRSETRNSGGDLINNTLATPLSIHLKKVKNDGSGLFTEIFVMDNHGLNVGQSDKTSDYWQGDEAKWKNTFLVGPGAVHISKIEFDESSQTYQAQVSVAVSDPETNTVIGAATFGISADEI